MLLDELIGVVEAKIAWGRRGDKVVKKYRCQGGRRHGKVVANPATCFAAPDIKKRIRLRQMKAKFGSRIARKSKKTKRVNPASRRIAALNKAAGGGKKKKRK